MLSTLPQPQPPPAHGTQTALACRHPAKDMNGAYDTGTAFATFVTPIHNLASVSCISAQRTKWYRLLRIFLYNWLVSVLALERWCKITVLPLAWILQEYHSAFSHARLCTRGNLSTTPFAKEV